MDRRVSTDEMEGIADQSIGVLCIAFAILICTVVEATERTAANGGGLISRFQAAIILDLSWMNNTSTFIWFLLYVHHRDKKRENNCHNETRQKGQHEILPATWSDWSRTLREPLDVFHLRIGSDTVDDGEYTCTKQGLAKYLGWC